MYLLPFFWIHYNCKYYLRKTYQKLKSQPTYLQPRLNTTYTCLLCRFEILRCDRVIEWWWYPKTHGIFIINVFFFWSAWFCHCTAHALLVNSVTSPSININSNMPLCIMWPSKQKLRITAVWMLSMNFICIKQNKQIEGVKVKVSAHLDFGFGQRERGWRKMHANGRWIDGKLLYVNTQYDIIIMHG